MTPRPKRAFLSLKSMLLMCFLISLFAAANLRDIRRGEPQHWGPIQGRPKPQADPSSVDVIYKTAVQTSRGFPWSYRTDVRVEWRRGSSSSPAEAVRFPFDYTRIDSSMSMLALNSVVAALASLLLALASERFVFSGWRSRSASNPPAR